MERIKNILQSTFDKDFGKPIIIKHIKPPKPVSMKKQLKQKRIQDLKQQKLEDSIEKAGVASYKASKIH
jgi:hypothetical protein